MSTISQKRTVHFDRMSGLIINKTTKFAVLDLPDAKQKPSTTSDSSKSSTAAPPTSAGSKAKGASTPNARPLDDLTGLRKSTMTLEERVATIISVGEEVQTEEELRALLKAKDHPIVYDGFEPSGRMHIAQGVLRAINVNKLTSAGCLFKFWVADWFAQLNNKMDGKSLFMNQKTCTIEFR